MQRDAVECKYEFVNTTVTFIVLISMSNVVFDILCFAFDQCERMSWIKKSSLMQQSMSIWNE